MARSRAGRFLLVGDACEVIDWRRVARDRYGLAVVHDNWCETHKQFVLTCVTCGRNFHSKRPHTKHCSTACSQFSYRQRAKQQEVQA